MIKFIMSTKDGYVNRKLIYSELTTHFQLKKENVY